MLSCQKHCFSLPDTVSYLNCATRSPLSKSVEEAGLQGMARERHPHLLTQNDFFTDAQRLREAYAELIHTPDPERIAIIPSVSYGMAVVAKNLSISAGEKIVIVGDQFPSNVYVWQTLAAEKGAEIVIVPAPDTLLNRGKHWNEAILEAIDARTRLVAIGNVHWTDGTLFNLSAIRQGTREVGALLVVDGTQSIGALPFDVEKIQPDALICAGYKWLMGPYSIGLAYYGAYFDEGKPLEENWINRTGSEDFAHLVNYQFAYRPKAQRYDVGERSNFILLPMLLAAVEQLNRWNISNIQAYCRNLVSPFIGELQELGCFIEEDAYRGSHMFGVRPPSLLSIDKLKAQLLQNQVFVAFRGTSIRISPNIYNDWNDMEKLLDSFKAVM